MNYSNDDELRDVASPAPAPKAEEAPETGAPRVSWWRRMWGQSAPEERFVITPKWAVEVVKATSWPLETYVHPAWALSYEEASKAAPEMQTFLQAVVDKYLPLLMKRFVRRHSVLLDMLAALSLVYVAKYKAIQKELESAKSGKPVGVPTPIKRDVQDAIAEAQTKVDGEIDHPETATGPESVVCESCQHTFKNALEAARHLPCKAQVQ